MKYSVCTDALFPGIPLEESLAAVSSLGWPAIEFWSFPDKDLTLMKQECRRLGLSVAAFCTDIRYNPVAPADHAAWLEGLQNALREAQALDCPALIVQAGWETGNASHNECRRALTHILEQALPLAEQNGITLLLEPLNTKVDHPGYHLSASEDAFSFIAQFQSPFLKILYDIYHQQITEGNILQTVSEHIGQIGHFHIAAVPGRIEPCSGELSYPLILTRIGQLGYTGYIGLEYMPKRDVMETLQECKNLLPNGSPL